MTETKHTPGPWMHCSQRGFFVVFAENKEMIVDTQGQGGIARMRGKADRQEEEFNAMLIAAAPDLLEACKHGLDELELHFDPSEFAPAVAEGIEKTIAILQAAIAKAEGRL